MRWPVELIKETEREEMLSCLIVFLQLFPGARARACAEEIDSIPSSRNLPHHLLYGRWRVRLKMDQKSLDA